MSIPLEFKGDDKGVAALMGSFIDQLKELKRQQAEVARDAAKLNKAQIAHLKDVAGSTKEVGRTVQAEARKNRQEVRLWALAYAGVTAGIATVKASYRVLDAGVQHVRRFRDESIAAYRAAKQSTEQWTLALRANNQQTAQQIANVRAISRASPYSANDIRGAQSILAPNANPAMLGKLTQVNADTAARSGKSNQEVANKFNELSLGGPLGNDWLQMGLSADFIKQQNAVIDGQKRMRALNASLDSGARSTNQWSEQDFKNLQELNALRSKYLGKNPQNDTINELARVNGGSAMRQAQARPDLQVSARWTEIQEKIGEWWEASLLPLYRKTADTLTQVLQDMERLGDTSKYISNFWEEASASFGRMLSGQGMTGTETGIRDLLSQLWTDLKEMLMGVLGALWAGLKESFRIAALYIEDGVLSAVRAIPGIGGSIGRSRLQNYEAAVAGDLTGFTGDASTALKRRQLASADPREQGEISRILQAFNGGEITPSQFIDHARQRAGFGLDSIAGGASSPQFNASGAMASLRRAMAAGGRIASGYDKGELSVLDLVGEASGRAAGRLPAAGAAKAAPAASADPAVGWLSAIYGVLAQSANHAQRQGLMPAAGGGV